MDKDHSTSPDTALRPENSERKAKIKYSRIKRKILRHTWFLRLLIVVGVFIILGVIGFGAFKATESLGAGNIFDLAYNFAKAPDGRIASVNGRTNILIMGKAGGSHSGPDLTDTMLLVSIGISKKDITIISIPRDIWIPEIQAKINSAYYWGKQNTSYVENLGGGGGISFAKIIAQEVAGVPVQYGVVIDFSAFKDIVDALGGVRVDVANSFTDNLYPIAGREDDACGGHDPTFSCRYETVTFDAGPQIMDGDTALKFVRSRHAEGIEGTDIAREARQQKVIDAIKNKVTNPSVFLSPKTDLAVLNIFKKYVETDIDGPTAAVLARKIIDADKNIHQYLIPDNLLFNPPEDRTYQNQYVFIPKAGSGNWKEINNWFSSVLN